MAKKLCMSEQDIWGVKLCYINFILKLYSLREEGTCSSHVLPVCGRIHRVGFLEQVTICAYMTLC